jgi:hypothetical protein
LALPKPQPIIDILGEAPQDVLPAASHRTSESFSSVDISYKGNYMHCHRGPLDRRARGRTEPFPDPPLARPCRLSSSPSARALPAPRVPGGAAGQISGRPPPPRPPSSRPTSSRAALLPGPSFPAGIPSPLRLLLPDSTPRFRRRSVPPVRPRRLSSSPAIVLPGRRPPRPISFQSKLGNQG